MPLRRTLLAAAAAIVAFVSVILIVVSSSKSEPVAVAAPPPAAPKAKPTPATVAPPTVVRPSGTAEATGAPVTSGQRPGLVESAKSALVGTENAALVTIRVSPPNAVVLKRGLRLGTGTVTINVARGTKTTLSAQLYGYVPRSFIVDGENSSIDIDLSRLPSANFTPKSKPDKATSAGAESGSASDPNYEPSFLERVRIHDLRSQD